MIAIDLLENYFLMPENLQLICDKYSNIFACEKTDPFQICRSFLVEVEAIGYTFDYGLDHMPFDLRAV